MTDNETNLAKWTAFASSSDPDAVGHTLNELAKRSTALEEAVQECIRTMRRCQEKECRCNTPVNPCPMCRFRQTIWYAESKLTPPAEAVRKAGG